ncbi:MAG: hypothetical protein H0X12_14855 [Nocardioides sp.]|nr:hypothetical protein [Nocardioides sp.]
MDDWQPIAPHPGRLVAPVPLDPTGRAGPTRGQARGPGWRTTSYGLFVPATVTDQLVEQRIIEASARLRGRGAVTGWAALRLHGAGFSDGLARDGRTRLPVPLLTGSSWLHASSETTVSRAELPASEVTVRHGVRVTTAERAVLDELQRLVPDLREMVVAIDMAAAARLTSILRMRRFVHDRARVVGIDFVHHALALADEGAASPQESRLRLIWVLDAALPQPICNRAVFSLRTGAFLGTPDLLDAEAGPAAEYDGGYHRSAARHRRDNHRREAFAGAGLESVTVVGGELQSVDLVVSRLRAAYKRAVGRRRDWMVGDPGPSLDEILDRRG